MLLADWLYGLLRLLSFRLKKKEAKVLFLGLDNAGKSTLLFLLKDQVLIEHPPTSHPISTELSIGNIKLKAFDFGGLGIARSVWTNYFAEVDAVIYMVDACDKERFKESRQELTDLLSNKSLANVPFLILGNKIDIQNGAATENELVHSLALTRLKTGKGKVDLGHSGVRPLEVFMCSIFSNMGYGEGLEWLLQYLH